MIPLEDVLAENATVLWAASTGGHFAQLERIAKNAKCSPDSLWITFDNAQTAHLRQEANVLYVPYIPPRGYRQVLQAAKLIYRGTRGKPFDCSVSTGAGIAGAVLPLTALRGIDSYYVESVSRTDGPSLTGKAMRYVPAVKTMTQHRRWSSRQWPYAGSVLHTWNTVPTNVRSNSPRKIFITLGTIRPYRFDRAVDAVLSILKDDDSCVWQIGCTSREDLPGDVHAELSKEAMVQTANDADVVITHAGVGTIMQMLDQGIVPVLAVRQSDHGEHVDNHQKLISSELTALGLAYELDLNNPNPEVLDRSRASRVSTND